MKRRDFLIGGTGTIAGAALASMGVNMVSTTTSAAIAGRSVINGNELKAPATGKINVAFAISDGATMIDFAGPWEVFQDVHVYDRGESMDEMMPFALYTVGVSTKPITASGGMKIIPNFSIDNAPKPDLVVVPAMRGSDELRAWLAKVAPETDVTMSVCTGAFQLAEAGLLDGQVATTHHDFYDSFEEHYPDIQLERNLRFVENPLISTAGGLTSGLDLALRVVERYFGRDVAQQTAVFMEYSSTGWMV